MHVVFVFAHQDDELAFASRIRYAVSRGDRVTCVCLTDGASSATATIRDAESRRVLSLLGGGELRVAEPAHRIPDGALPERLDDALHFLESVAPTADEVITLAWEGGHQDHDAAHLVAAVYARARGVSCLEVPFYNRHRAFGPFFRVLHPLGDGWTARRVTRREMIANVLLARHYRSQRRTWLGLVPQMLLSRARELTRTVDLARTAAPPHRGALLYEHRFRYPYSRFAPLAAEFLRRRGVRD
jgi:LmbE family N-acetylglucosaminyl deacetylase